MVGAPESQKPGDGFVMKQLIGRQHQQTRFSQALDFYAKVPVRLDSVAEGPRGY